MIPLTVVMLYVMLSNFKDKGNINYADIFMLEIEEEIIEVFSNSK